jgi:signal transduction histidine kinase
MRQSNGNSGGLSHLRRIASTSPPGSSRSSLNRFGVAVVVLLGLTLPCCVHPSPVAGPSAPRHVLALYWEGRDGENNILFEEGFKSVLHAGTGEIDYDAEYLESDLATAERQDSALREYLRHKYSGKQIDVIVAESEPVLSFLVESRKTLFTNVPIVYFAFTPPVTDVNRAGPGLTGVLGTTVFRRTVDAACRLQPDTKQVLVVIGLPGPGGKTIETVVRQELVPLAGVLDIQYLTNLPTDTVIDRVARAPAHSIVLYVQYFSDAPDKPLHPIDALSLISQSSRVPVYGVAATYVGHGVVGGYVVNQAALGAQMAQVAARVAHGALPRDIPVTNAALAPVFDWRELRRWGINDDRLPPGSVVRFQKVTPRNWAREMTAAAMILVLSVLSGVLVLEHRRRSRAEIEARRYLATMAHMDRQAAMGELTTSLAHELNQPLAAILRNAEAAKMQLASGSPALHELEEIVEDIRKDDKRAADLIRRMRTLLRRRELEALPVNMSALARETIDLVAPEAASKSVRVDLEVGSGAAVVTGDRVHLQQVLLNLVLNGMDAMTGTPSDRRRLTVRTATANGYVDMSVKDTGRGIPSDSVSRIFEPFFTTKTDGMGMGLSIARSIIEAHEGRIVAENNVDGGATVRFSLPVRLADKEKVDHASRRS